MTEISFWPTTSEALAAWVQAIGSIVTIIVAFAVAFITTRPASSQLKIMGIQAAIGARDGLETALEANTALEARLQSCLNLLRAMPAQKQTRKLREMTASLYELVAASASHSIFAHAAEPMELISYAQEYSYRLRQHASEITRTTAFDVDACKSLEEKISTLRAKVWYQGNRLGERVAELNELILNTEIKWEGQQLPQLEEPLSRFWRRPR